MKISQEPRFQADLEEGRSQAACRTWAEMLREVVSECRVRSLFLTQANVTPYR